MQILNNGFRGVKNWKPLCHSKEPKISYDTRKIDVIADINNQPLWQPGATVKGSIIFKSREGIAVPEQSIVQRPAGKTVYGIENNVAKSKKVEVGISQDGFIEIKEGISPGETIAVDGASFLTNNIEININNNKMTLQ